MTDPDTDTIQTFEVSDDDESPQEGSEMEEEITQSTQSGDGDDDLSQDSDEELLPRNPDIVQLQRDYGYNDYLFEILRRIFSLADLKEFLRVSDIPRPVTVRVNTLKARRKDVAQSLINKGVNLDPVADWTREALIIYDQPIPIGSTTEYLAGHYMPQSVSSLLPVLALDPKPGDHILDMCAAPGGKTTHIAQLMKNSGMIWANDKNKARLTALSSNLHRMGVLNSIVSNCDGKDFPALAGGFTRVLVDAPCTGLGIISRDASIKSKRVREHFDRCVQTQRDLILAAIDSTKAYDPNNPKQSPGVIVYSTCTITVRENEQIVDFALKRRHIKVVDTGLSFGLPGLKKFRQHRFHPSVQHCRRYYPHVHNMDGFFVCKIIKISDKKTVPPSLRSLRPRNEQHVFENGEFINVKQEKKRRRKAAKAERMALESLASNAENSGSEDADIDPIDQED